MCVCVYVCVSFYHIYDITTPTYMTSLHFFVAVFPKLLWRHCPLLLWRHYLHYYDVIAYTYMTSLPPLLWRHCLHLYDVTTSTIMTSLPTLIWRHYLYYYDVTAYTYMTSRPGATILCCRLFSLRTLAFRYNCTPDKIVTFFLFRIYFYRTTWTTVYH